MEVRLGRLGKRWQVCVWVAAFTATKVTTFMNSTPRGELHITGVSMHVGVNAPTNMNSICACVYSMHMYICMYVCVHNIAQLLIM